MFLKKYDTLLKELEIKLSNIIKAAGTLQGEDGAKVLDISQYRFMFNNTYCPMIALDEQGSLFFVHKLGSYHIWGCKNLKTMCELADKLLKKHFFIFTYDGNINANYDIIINIDNVKVFFGDHSEAFDIEDKEYYSKGDKVYEVVAGEDAVREMVNAMNLCVHEWVTNGQEEIRLGFLEDGVLLSSKNYTGTKFEVERYKDEASW